MKNILLFIFLALFSLTAFGFSPYDSILHTEDYRENKLIDSLSAYHSNNYKKTLHLLENHHLVDSIIFTAKKECIENTLSNYKQILIDETNNYIKNNDYTSANNLINSKSKYFNINNTFNTLKKNTKPNLNNTKLVTLDDITFLTFDTLMAFPEKALSPNNNFSSFYDETKLTTSEFNSILNELYKNNFILIGIYDIYNKNTKRINPLYIPANKKPIIFSFNNVTYRSNYQNLGEIDKIIIDRNNNIATYTTKKSIQDRVQYNNEFVVILEKFIKDRPDFSHNNAKGIIFLSGENGILGYNTSHKNASSRHEAKRVAEVIHKLKANGWVFGCHNYTYNNENNKTDIEFAKDLSLWNKEISPLIGETDLYSYPLGDEIKSTQKKELLISSGFNIFFSFSTYSQASTSGDLINIIQLYVNGKNLRENSESFDNLFSSEKVYDHANRCIPYCS